MPTSSAIPLPLNASPEPFAATVASPSAPRMSSCVTVTPDTPEVPSGPAAKPGADGNHQLSSNDQVALRQSLVTWAAQAGTPDLFPFAHFALPSGTRISCRHHPAVGDAEPRLEIRVGTFNVSQWKQQSPQRCASTELTDDRAMIGSASMALDVAMQSSPTVVLLNEDSATQWLSTVQHLLPSGARSEFYFSGWEMSPPASAPHMVILLSEASMASCRCGQSYLDLRDAPSDLIPPSTPWGRRLQAANRHGGWSAIIEWLQRVPSETTLDDLRNPAAAWLTQTEVVNSCMTDATPEQLLCLLSPSPVSRSDFQLNLEGERILERLDELDTAAFAAMSGDSVAMDEFARLWPSAQQDIDPSWLEESRQHYVRQLVDCWQDQLTEHGQVNAATAEPGLNLLRILLGTSYTDRL